MTTCILVGGIALAVGIGLGAMGCFLFLKRLGHNK